MLARDGELSHFDHALNAMLLLAWVAQKQGDGVGVMTFGAQTRWLAPQKGRVGLDRLLSSVYDLQPAEIAPDYTLAAESLLGRLRKRAFVVLLTNLRDEDDQALSAPFAASVTQASGAMRQPTRISTRCNTRYTGHSLQPGLAPCRYDYLAQRSESSHRLGLRSGMLLD